MCSVGRSHRSKRALGKFYGVQERNVDLRWVSTIMLAFPCYAHTAMLSVRGRYELYSTSRICYQHSLIYCSGSHWNHLIMPLCCTRESDILRHRTSGSEITWIFSFLCASGQIQYQPTMLVNARSLGATYHLKWFRHYASVCVLLTAP